MKKYLLIVLSILAILIVLCTIGIATFSCARHNYNGTYYLYSNGSYDKTDYLVLDGSTMTDDAGASVPYEIKDGHIYIYFTVYGIQTTVSGTIKDGVIEIQEDGFIKRKTYCKEGAKPQTGNTNEQTQHTHSYIKTVIDPTCASPGYTLEKCSICGDEFQTDAVPATGAHDYVNGVCSVCGEAQQITDGNYFKFTLLADDTYEIRVKDANNLPSAVTIAPSYYGTKVTRIREEAFQNCTKLTSIVIPDGVTSIGEKAFYGCTNLTKVTIPGSVTSIGSSAFYGCSSLTNIVIPDGVTSIGSSAFYGCSRLTDIAIPDSVTIIGKSAFANCDSLQYDEYDNGLYLGNSMNPYHVMVGTRSRDIANCIIHKNTKIISGAFENCNNIRNISIPNSVTSIGDRAFYDCSRLTSLTIPSGVTSIGDSAFSSCSSLTSVTIPDSVTSIGEYAFSGCSSLTSVTIPDSVTSIEGYAFYYCKSLTSVTIPDSVTSIGRSAFSVCNSLTSMTIPDGVTSIGDFAFADCENLVTVTIPNSVTSIGYHVFYQSRDFRQIIFIGTRQEWNSISKSTGWNITNYARNYAHDESIRSLTIHCTDGDVAI